jgi:tRNA-dihydrouridine synthase
MTAEVINAKQGLTRIPTYAELIKEIDREKFKTNDIRKIFDRNAWYFHGSPQGQALNTNNIHAEDLQQMNFKKIVEEATARKKHPTD